MHNPYSFPYSTSTNTNDLPPSHSFILCIACANATLFPLISSVGRSLRWCSFCSHSEARTDKWILLSQVTRDLQLIMSQTPTTAGGKELIDLFRPHWEQKTSNEVYTPARSVPNAWQTWQTRTTWKWQQNLWWLRKKEKRDLGFIQSSWQRKSSLSYSLFHLVQLFQ